MLHFLFGLLAQGDIVVEDRRAIKMRADLRDFSKSVMYENPSYRWEWFKKDLRGQEIVSEV